MEADAARFAGRARELALFDRFLGEEDRVSVVLVHGAGGVGKSTLLREVGRRAGALGYSVFAVDGREVSPAPGELERALAGIETAERPLLLLDTYERVAALGAHLRTRVLPQLPAAARVVIAGRLAPDDGWRQGGWDAVTLPVALSPLSEEDAGSLLRLRGVTDPLARAELVAWAAGSPLALALAADGVIASGLAAAGDDGELVRRLVGDELDGADLDVVAVAAIAHSVDARLLEDVLDDVDGDHALAWLRGLSFAEALGAGVTLHERVRRSLQRELESTDPGRERELRRRVADHLHTRSRVGRFLHFGELVHDPAVRWGFGVDAGRTHRADTVRDGDREAVATALRDDAAFWNGVARWFDEARDSVITVRDAAGTIVGFGVTTSPADAPAWADADPVIAPVLAHARAQGDATALIRRDAVDLTAGRAGDPRSPVVAVLNADFALRGDLQGVRRQYCIIDAHDQAALEFTRAGGLAHLSEFDQEIDGRRLHYHLLDHGPGGVMETGRALVYRELGLVPATAAPPGPLDAATVRDALRAFDDPLLLVASPLARGTGAGERVESVRALLRSAIEAEFGTSPAERLLRSTLERGYLDPDGGHDRAALELNVSRATYFRRVATAVQRITPRVLARG